MPRPIESRLARLERQAGIGASKRLAVLWTPDAPPPTDGRRCIRVTWVEPAPHPVPRPRPIPAAAPLRVTPDPVPAPAPPCGIAPEPPRTNPQADALHAFIRNLTNTRT
jgi:hypothetical protein